MFKKDEINFIIIMAYKEQLSIPYMQNYYLNSRFTETDNIYSYK